MMRHLQKPIASVGRRFMGTTVPHNSLLPKAYQNQSIQKNFLSDPSTYPLIVILTGAGCFIVGMSANALGNYKDLRIKPSEKHETIPTWNGGHRTMMTEVLGRNPIGMHSDGFKSLQQEGLGVDHEEWKRSKQS